jgi:hypothetical protein
MLDDSLKTQLQAYLQNAAMPITLVASLDDSPLQRHEGPARGCGLHLRQDQPEPTGTTPASRRSPSPVGEAPRCDSRRCRWAMSSPRWCWRCCGRRSPAQGSSRADRAGQGPGRRLPLRDLFLAELPQLPGRGAGAQPDGGAEPRISHVDRRRPVPGRSGSSARSWPCRWCS